MDNMENALIALEREQAHIREELAVQKEQIKQLFSFTQENKELTKSVQSLTLSVKELANTVKINDERLDSVSSDIKEIKAKPGKRWDKIIETVITVIVTAAVTYLIAKGGTP